MKEDKITKKQKGLDQYQSSPRPVPISVLVLVTTSFKLKLFSQELFLTYGI